MYCCLDRIHFSVGIHVLLKAVFKEEVFYFIHALSKADLKVLFNRFKQDLAPENMYYSLRKVMLRTESMSFRKLKG